VALRRADEGPGDAERREETWRAFVAIALDAPARAALAKVVAALRAAPGGGDVRWVRPENLHVTLCFLGDAAPARLSELALGLRAALAAFAPFALTFGALAPFPSPRRARVVSCGVGPEAPLVRLAGGVHDVAARCGFALEERPFRPHLTLGRIRRGGRAPVTASVTPPSHPVPVDEIVLYRSHLAATGAQYTPLVRFALGGKDHP